MAKKITTAKSTTSSKKNSTINNSIANKTLQKLSDVKFHSLTRYLAPCAMLLGVLGFCVALSTYCNANHNNKILEQRISHLSGMLEGKITDNRKVYVFNMNAALEKSGIALLYKKFETDVAQLDAEVTEAQNKIKSLKDAKVKAEFSDVYINSLRLKRDTMIEEYQKLMNSTLKTINEALVAIAIEKKVPTIFMENIIAVKTRDVVDVTPEVIKKIEEMKKEQQ